MREQINFKQIGSSHHDTFLIGSLFSFVNRGFYFYERTAVCSNEATRIRCFGQRRISNYSN